MIFHADNGWLLSLYHYGDHERFAEMAKTAGIPLERCIGKPYFICPRSASCPPRGVNVKAHCNLIACSDYSHLSFGFGGCSLYTGTGGKTSSETTGSRATHDLPTTA